MYSFKQYLFIHKINICCVIETHLNKRRERWFREVFGDQYIVIVKNMRDMKKMDKVSGGIAILVKKTIGKIERVMKKRSNGLMWISIKCEGRIIYLAPVYIVPVGSTRYEQNVKMSNF